jgi:murein DD-endopeptidase MepM/ murein hydrolase activator NlpD
LARHRTHGGQRPSPAPPAALSRACTRPAGAHRAQPQPAARRGRIVVAAVTASTFAAAGSALNPDGLPPDTDLAPLVRDANAGGTIGAIGAIGIGGDEPVVQLLTVPKTGTGQIDRLSRGQYVAVQRAAREAERAQAARQAEAAAREAAARDAAARAAEAARQAEARRPRAVAPTTGRLTSTYGSRWGTMHWGIDIANSIGTPILSAADGVVVEAGPASGFGLWVRVRHADGTITVYGHVDRTLVREGQAVKAGQRIATMGNRGQSTGPHLHFEVWTAGGAKTNPLTWLRARGVRI